MALVIFLNPPRGRAKPKKPTKSAAARRRAALANLAKARAALDRKRGKAAPKRAKAKARPKRKSGTRSTKMARKMTPRQRAAALKNLAKARRARKKTTRKPARRKRTTTRKAPARKRAARKPASRKRRRKSTTRPARRSSPGSRHRVRLRKYRGRYYQGRRGSLKGKTIKVNPPLVPNMKSIMGIVSTGGYGAVGYFGVNAVVMGVRKSGVLSFADSQSPTVQALISLAIRALAVPLVTRAAGMVFKGGNARQAIMVGAAVNVGLNGIRDLAASTGALPAWGTELLLSGGEPGFADHLTMSDYVDSFGPNGLPAKTAPLQQAGNALITGGAFV